jgi:hypothetical protein
VVKPLPVFAFRSGRIDKAAGDWFSPLLPSDS